MAKRQFVSFPFSDLYKTKQQLFNWSSRFETCCFLDSQSYPSGYASYECLAAVGEKARLQAPSGTAFHKLKEFSTVQDDWLFGHFSFNLKSETENLPARLPDFVNFPDLFFYVPEIVIGIRGHELEIGLCGTNHHVIFHQISSEVLAPRHNTAAPVAVQSRIPKKQYLDAVRRLQTHIRRGDCYEINFCQEFFAEHISIDPAELYRALKEASPSPFSAYYSVDEKYLLCASPERYLKKTGSRILSQPIKGTIRRDTSDAAHDAQLRDELASSEKDRAENVMVVDLVRNDLSKICETDSVFVQELFGIYSFAQVHQMISTIMGKPRAGLHWSEMIAGTFPMGSMTGAPKKRVLELIEAFEQTGRGLFSGALGYVQPNQDFDFNVVIRSMLYNRSEQYLAYFAGSGITINSDPDKEYEECLLKVEAFERLISR